MWGMQSIFYKNYKWSVTFKHSEPLYCTPVTWASLVAQLVESALYINYIPMKNQLTKPSMGENMEQLELSQVVGKNVKPDRHSRQYFAGFYKVKHTLTKWPKNLIHEYLS